MNRSLTASLAFALLIGVSTFGFAESAAKPSATPAPDAGWTRLFDGKSFRGWHTKIQNQKVDDDPEKFFQVDDGAIHVYKDQVAGTPVPNGYLATEAEYSYYDLRLDFKWGAKQFKPRLSRRRDAGLLYHVVGPDVVWPRCVEFQIQEGDVGDCFTVRGAQVGIMGELIDVAQKIYRYKPAAEGGTPQSVGDGSICRVIKSSTHEQDGWNNLELVVRGSEGRAHIVNGVTVFQSDAIRQLSSPSSLERKPATNVEKKWLPLAKGRIALQCEYAEVFYRNIEIRPIPDGPLTGKAE